MKNMCALVLCIMLSMNGVITLGITSSLQKSPRILNWPMAVPAHVGIIIAYRLACLKIRGYPQAHAK